MDWLCAARTRRLVLGMVLWLGAIALGGYLAAPALDAEAPAGRWARDLLNYLTRASTPQRFELDRPQTIAVGDPLFIFGKEGLIQVGEVSALIGPEGVVAARKAEVGLVEVRLYPGVAPPRQGDRITYHTAETSLAWVVKTLLTPERKKAIVRELEQVLQAHREEMVAALRPIIEAAVRDALHVVAADLPPAVRQRREQFARLAGRYQHELVEQELLPLVNEVIWPIVQRRAEPAVRDLGRELWARVSLWAFTWRAFVDKLPWTDGTLVEEEFQRFVRDEAVPILRRRIPRLVEVVRDILQDVAANPRVRSEANENINRLIDDPELAGLVEEIFVEVVVTNPRLHDTLRQRWESPETQQALAQVGRHWEPALRRIGDLLFGTPSTGITPEFAAVLRNQILHKDRRWFLWEPTAVPTGGRAPGSPPLPLPSYRVHRWRPVTARSQTAQRVMAAEANVPDRAAMAQRAPSQERAADADTSPPSVSPSRPDR